MNLQEEFYQVMINSRAASVHETEIRVTEIENGIIVGESLKTVELE